MTYYVHDLTLDAVSFVLPRPYDRRLLIVSGPRGVDPLVELLRGVSVRELRLVVLAAVNSDTLRISCGGFGRAGGRHAHRVHSAAGSMYCSERALQQVIARFAHAVIARARLLGLENMDERGLRLLSRTVMALDAIIGASASPAGASAAPIPVAREYSESTRH